jgi:hypothetical protein
MDPKPVPIPCVEYEGAPIIGAGTVGVVLAGTGACEGVFVVVVVVLDADVVRVGDACVLNERDEPNVERRPPPPLLRERPILIIFDICQIY